MFLAELRIENFRIFGEGKDALLLPFKPGLTALVGENDTGKTAIMDAIRFAFGTRDQEYMRVEESDFHQPPDGSTRKTEMLISCKFSHLSPSDMLAFPEYERQWYFNIYALKSPLKALKGFQEHKNSSLATRFLTVAGGGSLRFVRRQSLKAPDASLRTLRGSGFDRHHDAHRDGHDDEHEIKLRLSSPRRR
jgi:hypothetical protein